MKSHLKSFARGCAIAFVSPLLMTHFLCSLLSDGDTSLECHSQLLSLVPGSPGSYLRVAFYRFTLAHCDASATIAFGTLFSKASASIGKNVYIGPRCMLGWVRLEDDVLLGPCVQIPSGPDTHGIGNLEIPIRCQAGKMRQITVGRDSWVGAGAIVLADVGEQSVVGAGSVLTKPTQSRTVNVGNPSSLLRSRE